MQREKLPTFSVDDLLDLGDRAAEFEGQRIRVGGFVAKGGGAALADSRDPMGRPRVELVGVAPHAEGAGLLVIGELRAQRLRGTFRIDGATVERALESRRPWSEVA